MHFRETVTKTLTSLVSNKHIHTFGGGGGAGGCIHTMRVDIRRYPHMWYCITLYMYIVSDITWTHPREDNIEAFR